MTRHLAPKSYGESLDLDDLQVHSEAVELKDDDGNVFAEFVELSEHDVMSDIWCGWHSKNDNMGGPENSKWTFGESHKSGRTYEENAAAYIEHLKAGVPSDKALEAYDNCQRAIEAELADVLHDVPNIRRRQVVGEDGDSIDIERYYARDVECWNSLTRTAAKKRAITLGVNFLGSCNQKDQYFINLTAGAAALVDALVNKGFAVKLVGTLVWEFPQRGTSRPKKYRNGGSYSDEGTFFGAYWTMTDYGERVDGVGLLPYASGATLRYLGFEITSALWPWCPKTPGFGTVSEMDPEIIKSMGIDYMVTARPYEGADEFAHSIASQAGEIVDLVSL